MDLSAMLPNRATRSYKVRRIQRVTRRSKNVWDLRKYTGDKRDIYVVRQCGRACKDMGKWSYHTSEED